MGREIKFRAFENENARGRMFQWDEIKKEFLDYLNCNDTFLMQFTGLKDKNGTDIYEGDIVKGFIHNIEIEGQKNDIIIFQNGKFEFKNTPSDLISFCYPLSIKQIEVIGNINENPELL